MVCLANATVCGKWQNCNLLHFFILFPCVLYALVNRSSFHLSCCIAFIRFVWLTLTCALSLSLAHISTLPTRMLAVNASFIWFMQTEQVLKSWQNIRNTTTMLSLHYQLCIIQRLKSLLIRCVLQFIVLTFQFRLGFYTPPCSQLLCIRLLSKVSVKKSEQSNIVLRTDL